MNANFVSQGDATTHSEDIGNRQPAPVRWSNKTSLAVGTAILGITFTMLAPLIAFWTNVSGPLLAALVGALTIVSAATSYGVGATCAKGESWRAMRNALFVTWSLLGAAVCALPVFYSAALTRGDLGVTKTDAVVASVYLLIYVAVGLLIMASAVTLNAQVLPSLAPRSKSNTE